MDRDWRQKALCHKRNNNFWYPPMDAEVPEHYYSVARAVCQVCPVWETCLKDGTKETWGMWGGLTPQERQALTNENPKPSILRSHGSWLRYRQGCRCELCVEGHSNHNESVNMDVIPYMGEPIGDLDSIRFNMLRYK